MKQPQAVGLPLGALKRGLVAVVDGGYRENCLASLSRVFFREEFFTGLTRDPEDGDVSAAKLRLAVG